jgi:hypothetical protein
VPILMKAVWGGRVASFLCRNRLRLELEIRDVLLVDMEDDPAARHVREDRVLDLRLKLVKALVREREAQLIAAGFRKDGIEGRGLEILEVVG